MKRFYMVGLAALAGCMGPGSTVETLAANPATVMLEYTRWNAEEQRFVIAQAQAHCQAYGKNAQMISQQPAAANPIDRLLATFNCI